MSRWPPRDFRRLKLFAEHAMRKVVRPGSIVAMRAAGVLCGGGALFAALSCNSASQTITTPSQPRCGVQAQAERLTFAPDGGTGTVRISANRECTWSARSESTWVTLAAPASGQGEGTVQFSVTANGDPIPRAGAIKIEDQQLQLSQEGGRCEFRLSSTGESVDLAGAERTITVSTASALCRWTAGTEVPWISVVAGREGSGSGAVTIRVDPSDGAPRSGRLLVAGVPVQIEQTPGCNVSRGYQVSPPTYTAAAAGGAAAFFVTAGTGCAWSASSAADWISVTAGQSGNGPGEVRVSVSANSGQARSGSVRIAEQTITIAQGSGCTVGLSQSRITVGPAQSTNTVQISTAAGCTWAATTVAPWITVGAGAAASGNGQVQLTVAANQGPAREGTVSVGGHILTVAQANGCTYAVAPGAQDIGAGGGSAAAAVSTGAGCPWTASSGASWITPAAPSGTGGGQLSFIVSANQGPARAGTLTIAGQAVTLRQASPCTWLLAPPSHEFGASGGGGNVLVVVGGSCSWTASSHVDWLSMTAGTSGTGNGLVQFVAAPNGGSARTGSLTIAGERYEVVQAGR